MAPPTHLSKIDQEILAALSGGSRTTPELTQLVAQSAYRRCRRLADLGLLQSKLGVRYVLFCIECQVVVTRENHQEHEDHEDQLRNTSTNVCIWNLTEKGQQEISS